VAGAGAVVAGAVDVGSGSEVDAGAGAGVGTDVDDGTARAALATHADDKVGRSTTAVPTTITTAATARSFLARSLSTVLCDESCEAERHPRRGVRRDPVSLPTPRSGTRSAGV
jgi:hypothetical protein